MPITIIPQPCPLHPDYKAIRPPRSTREGCVCKSYFNAVQAIRTGSPYAAEVLLSGAKLTAKFEPLRTLAQGTSPLKLNGKPITGALPTTSIAARVKQFLDNTPYEVFTAAHLAEHLHSSVTSIIQQTRRASGMDNYRWSIPGKPTYYGQPAALEEFKQAVERQTQIGAIE